jgi:hypothetical protein
VANLASMQMNTNMVMVGRRRQFGQKSSKDENFLDRIRTFGEKLSDRLMKSAFDKGMLPMYFTNCYLLLLS